LIFSVLLTVVHFASAWSMYQVVFWRLRYSMSYTDARLWYELPPAGQIIVRERRNGELWAMQYPASLVALQPPDQLSGFAVIHYSGWSHFSGFVGRNMPTVRTNPLVICVPMIGPVVAAWVGFGALVWLDRRARRLFAGACLVCCYSRKGLVTGAACPECGSAG
jgi:hypothetical protein